MDEGNIFEKGLFFVPLGGAEEVGMNLNLYGVDDQWLMVDLGVSFGQEVGIEVFMPDPDFIVNRREKLKGILLTHAHEDHIGAVPYLWKYLRAPLYATPFTAKILRHKLKEAGLLQEVPIHEIPLNGHVQIGPFGVRLLAITHSIIEPNAVILDTPYGRVVHTGDWKLDPDPLVGKATDSEAYKAIGDEGVLALVCDSTNVFEPGRSGSEGEVAVALKKAMKGHAGRVVVSCFASNLARVSTIAENAFSMGRKVCLLGRAMERMIQAAQETGYLTHLPRLGAEGEGTFDEQGNRFLTPAQASKVAPGDLVVITTGSQAEPHAGLTRLAGGLHPDLTLEKGDTVIFSSRVIPGNEKAINALQNRLIRKGIQLIVPSKLHRTSHLHVSGHPAREELKEMYAWIRPEVLIPVHGEPRHLQEQAALAKSVGISQVIEPHNGAIIELSSHNSRIVGETAAARLGYDGMLLVPMNSPVLKERRKMGAQGVVVATLLLDHYGEELAGLQVSHFGLMNAEETPERAERLDLDLEKGIFTALKNLNERDWEKDVMVKQACIAAIRRVTQTRLGKRPLCEIHLVREGA